MTPHSPAAAEIAGEQLALFRGPDRWVRRVRIASASTAGRTYTVASDAAGRWGCSCPAWIYDPARPPCKHIRAAVAAERAAATVEAAMSPAIARSSPR